MTTTVSIKDWLKSIFTPFGNTSKKTDYGIMAFYIVTIAIFWYWTPEKSLVPSLGDTLEAWGDLWRHGLLYHILKTLQLFLYASVIGIPLAALIAYSSKIAFFKPISTILSKLRFNPITGFTLFLMFATKGGRTLQVTLLVIFMSFFFITGLVSMIQEVNSDDRIRRETMKMGPWRILWKVIIVDRRDYLIELIRQNLAMMCMMIVSVEGIDKGQGGIGALIIDTNRGLAFPKIFALQLTILCIGITLDFTLRKIYNSYAINKKNREE